MLRTPSQKTRIIPTLEDVFAKPKILAKFLTGVFLGREAGDSSIGDYSDHILSAFREPSPEDIWK